MSNILGMDNLLKELAKIRPVFYSEADFQFALGWLIQQKNENYKVRFEYTYHPNYKSPMHIDILVITDKNEWIPIELKYKTRRTTSLIKCKDGELEEEFILSNHSAKDQNCYRYLKDIQRIETIKEEQKEKFVEGYAIMLTNDKSYQEEQGESVCYHKFSIHPTRTIHKNTKLDWKEGTSDGTKKGMTEPIELKGSYTMEWKEYHIFSEPKTEFYYLITKILKSVE